MTSGLGLDLIAELPNEGADTIDFSATTTLNVSVNLGTLANQIVNASVKLYMIWRLPKQRWVNRGNQRSGAGGGALLSAMRTTMAAYLTVFSVALLLVVALLLTNSVATPSLPMARAIYADLLGWLR